VHLSDEQIRTMSLEEKDRWWLDQVYKGDMPQLTIRAAVTGMGLGLILSLTNLYIGIMTGWTLGVGVTSVILFLNTGTGLIRSCAHRSKEKPLVVGADLCIRPEEREHTQVPPAILQPIDCHLV